MYQALDDGDSQTGAEINYSRDSWNNIVTDNTTGLMWEDDADTVVRTTYSWYDAVHKCANLTAGDYYDWRLPTYHELMGLYQYGNASPSLAESFLAVIGGVRLWSSNSSATSRDYALTMFQSGLNSQSWLKSESYYARCVRGEQSAKSVFVHSADYHTVTDLATGLVWQDDAGVEAATFTWLEALDYCSNLALDGNENWRLPNINEFLTIVDI